ncbi:MAG: outer membrane beta-barrel protein [Candidatus Polarisedimenticolia bacterium]
MQRTLSKALPVVLLAGVALGGEVLAQNREKAWEVTPYLGSIRYGGASSIDDVPQVNDTTTFELEDDLSFGFRFGYHYTKRHMIEFGFGGTGTRGDLVAVVNCSTGCQSRTGNFKADVLTGRANYVFNFFLHRRDKVVAFVTGGIGVINFSTFGSASDPEVQAALERLVGDENHLLLNYGGGIRFFGSEKVGVRLDARQVHYDTTDRGRENHIEISLGVTLILGGV